MWPHYYVNITTSNLQQFISLFITSSLFLFFNLRVCVDVRHYLETEISIWFVPTGCSWMNSHHALRLTCHNKSLMYGQSHRIKVLNSIVLSQPLSCVPHLEQFHKEQPQPLCLQLLGSDLNAPPKTRLNYRIVYPRCWHARKVYRKVGKLKLGKENKIISHVQKS